MKILFTVLDIQDYGGITADLELKCKGLREAGHTVKVVILRSTDTVKSIRRSHFETGPTGSYPSEFGKWEGKQIYANTKSGWYFAPTIGIGSKEGLEHWKKIANKFDVIFHEIPGPNPDEAGHWLEMYDVEPKQIMIAHDAHFRDMYPHIIKIAPKLQGIACTNPAGYMSLAYYPGYRAFIGAPHPVLDWDAMPRWKDRKKVGVAAHIWKAWKHNEMIVKACPKLKHAKMIMAGDGIERHYMTSKTKCPKEFKGIWDAAINSGNMKYVGLITPEKLFKRYQNSRVMVDMSWSHKFNDLGNHFNRSIIEGYNNGVVPVCTAMNMRDDNTQRRLFKGGKTHIEISHKASNKEVAEAIDYAANLKEDDAMEIIERGRKIFSRFFDYRVASLEFLKLAEQKPAGVYPVLEKGELNPGIKKACRMKIEGSRTTTISAMLRRYERKYNDGN